MILINRSSGKVFQPRLYLGRATMAAQSLNTSRTPGVSVNNNSIVCIKNTRVTGTFLMYFLINALATKETQTSFPAKEQQSSLHTPHSYKSISISQFLLPVASCTLRTFLILPYFSFHLLIYTACDLRLSIGKGPSSICYDHLQLC